jgi:hypothetical protein
MKFEQEYPAAAAKLQNFYTHLSLTEQETMTSPKEKVRVNEYMAAGDLVALKVTRLETNPDEPDNPEPQTIYVSRPDLVFRARNKSHDSPYVLDNVHDSPTIDDVQGIRVNTKLPFAPYCWLDLTVLETMKRPTFQIEKVVEIQQNGALLLQVLWTCTFESYRGGELKRAGSFLFDPSHAWVLRGYAVGMQGNEARMRCTIDYEGSHEGIPLVAAAKYWTDLEDEGRTNESVVKVLDLKLQTPANEVFTLPYYGIPESVAGSKELPDSSLAKVLFVIANVGIVLAIVMFLIFRQRRSIQK